MKTIIEYVHYVPKRGNADRRCWERKTVVQRYRSVDVRIESTILLLLPYEFATGCFCPNHHGNDLDSTRSNISPRRLDSNTPWIPPFLLCAACGNWTHNLFYTKGQCISYVITGQHFFALACSLPVTFPAFLALLAFLSTFYRRTLTISPYIYLRKAMGNVRSLVIKLLDETTTHANDEWKSHERCLFLSWNIFRIFGMISFIYLFKIWL